MLSPKSNRSSRFYGLPTVYKTEIPIRPIVDYTTSPTYKLAKFISRIIKPLQNKLVSNVEDFDFVDKLGHVTLCCDETFLSFDVTTLYTSVPVKHSTDVVKQLLESDDSLGARTNLSPSEILSGLELCLHSTLFTINKKLYRQTDGVAFLNSKCNGIVFTLETETDERSLNFLDCLVKVDEQQRFQVSVYRKPTQSGRYLNFNSSHPIGVKRAVIKSLVNTANKICTTQLSRTTEISHIKEMLAANHYPNAFIENTIKRMSTKEETKKTRTFKSTVQISYREQTSEKIRSALWTVFRLDDTLQRLVTLPKDPISMGDQTDCVYEIKCGDCNASYIGETSRQLKRLEKDSAIALHALAENHNVGIDQARVIHKGLASYAERCCAEALTIYTQHACVNRNDSKPLSAVWRGWINSTRHGRVLSTSVSPPLNPGPLKVTVKGKTDICTSEKSQHLQHIAHFTSDIRNVSGAHENLADTLPRLDVNVMDNLSSKNFAEIARFRKEQQSFPASTTVSVLVRIQPIPLIAAFLLLHLDR
ncbi:uncharacterized protein DEA37_0001512 [Paragonimus westermani]|uniref:Helix-turn-helix domain-containing protein n=1 Tax=Paragonimus westermani TaxID=34504 RepID=A0A5J4N7J0_9TREM|nr:uncharacterized protein DEA37_0001512 [Paragonimus westermani]